MQLSLKMLLNSAHLLAVSTSLVPLSLMPYLSLVFLILSEMLLINFFISYSWGKRIIFRGLVQRLLNIVQKKHWNLTKLYDVWHMIRCHAVVRYHSKTGKVWTMQPPIKPIEQYLKKQSAEHVRIQADWRRLFYCKRAITGLLNQWLICSKSCWHTILDSVKAQSSMLAHYTSRYFSEPVAVNSFAKGGKGSHVLLRTHQLAACNWLWVHIMTCISL